MNLLLGLIAMNKAGKHLILIGDDDQLQLITRETGVNTEDIPERYRVLPEQSFLGVCAKLFGLREVYLNEHHRCHPDIIGFCKEYIYDPKAEENGGPLVIRTAAPEGQPRPPIRVLWYPGEYSEAPGLERRDREGQEEPEYFRPKGMTNRRQVEIFMADEWPRLRELLDRDPELRVCVLCPYKAPLEAIRARLAAENVETRLDAGDGAAGELRRDIPALTIHSVQGKGFHIVCFLSAVDYYDRFSAAWAQERRMINVAVSRAVREFHVITAAQWLPETLQRESLGRALPLPKLRDPREADPSREGEDGFYLVHFLNYVYELVRDQAPDEVFGFHRSSITSVFDEVPYLRPQNTGGVQRENNFATEKRMAAFLKEICGTRYQIRRGVPLRLLYTPGEGDGPELTDFVSCGAHVDFLVCDRDDRALLALEVDGSYHRTGMGAVEQKRRDALKDACFRERIGEKLKLLRLPTDGSGRIGGTVTRADLGLAPGNTPVCLHTLEEERACVGGLLERAEGGIRLSQREPAGGEDLLAYLIPYFIDGICLRRLQACCPGPEEIRAEAGKDLPELRYFNQRAIREGIDYADRDTNAHYFCKFGQAYAFEYAMYCDLLLRMFEGDTLSVLSLGCGGRIDAWALAYARELRRAQGRDVPAVVYEGIDEERWAYFALPYSREGSVTVPVPGPEWAWVQEKTVPAFTVKPLCRGSICDLGGRRSLDAQALIFPKILDELDKDDLDAFVETLKGDSLSLPRDAYYILAALSFRYAENCGDNCYPCLEAVEAAADLRPQKTE